MPTVIFHNQSISDESSSDDEVIPVDSPEVELVATDPLATGTGLDPVSNSITTDKDSASHRVADFESLDREIEKSEEIVIVEDDDEHFSKLLEGG